MRRGLTVVLEPGMRTPEGRLPDYADGSIQIREVVGRPTWMKPAVARAEVAFAMEGSDMALDICRLEGCRGSDAAKEAMLRWIIIAAIENPHIRFVRAVPWVIPVGLLERFGFFRSVHSYWFLDLTIREIMSCVPLD